MIVELRGVGTVNKGAYLMLKAICHEFEKRGRNDLLVSPITFGFSKHAIKSEGLKIRLSGKKFRINYARILRLVPKKLRTKLGLIFLEDVDVILDASGFLYGDQWPIENIKIRLSNDLDILAKNQTRIILLPQAFGPFDRKEIKDEVGKIFPHCSLIFARDQLSLNYVSDAYGILPTLHLAPDFTNLVTVSPTINAAARPRFVIIPNAKITVHEPQKIEAYYSMLIRAARLLLPHYDVFILIHEGDNDARVARAINEKGNLDLEIIRFEDPLAIKRAIGECHGVITGRFHGLVSALSQGIPALATSWSHKYVELLKNYEFEEGLLNITDSPDYLEEKLDIFKNDGTYQSVRDKIVKNAVIEKRKSNEMWDQVFKTMS